MSVKIPPPRLDRSIHVDWIADGEGGNLSRVAAWLSGALNGLAGPHSTSAIWNGRGSLSVLRAVGRGQVDVAVSSLEDLLPLVLDGRGIMNGEAFPHLRVLGHVPQRDRIIFALRRDLGITSYDDLRRKKPKLRVSTAILDGSNWLGWSILQMMSAAGVSREAFESWGGVYTEFDQPRECCKAVQDGEADGLIMEAVHAPYWKELADKIDLVFLEIEPEVRDQLKREFGWETATLPKDYLRGIDREIEFMKFNHFPLLTTTDLPDDVAYAIAWASIEKYSVLERQYWHLPSDRSPVNYPIDPKAAARMPIAYHPGAERYFRDAGHL